MTRDTRSPLERMVDGACGVPEGFVPPPRITLRCPKCEKEARVLKMRSDPPPAELLVLPCTDCHGPDYEEWFYYDANGEHITADPEAPDA